MFDRWRKLGKAFYSEKRGEFDISKASSATALPSCTCVPTCACGLHGTEFKSCGSCAPSTLQVPDIYDSAKYDSIHNRHLGLDFRDLYQVRWAVHLNACAAL